MSSQDPVNELSSWLQTYDSTQLQNEDDVETKFVLPLFRLLGYPENCRRGKYPLSIYNPGKQGRKPEIDQVYFSESDPSKQNSDTALVIVEAKEPQVSDLRDAVEQARFYSAYLRPLFLFISNGKQIMVLKRLGFRGDEILFDVTVEDKKSPSWIEIFYKYLNFAIAHHSNAHITDVLTHAQYVKLERDLRRYPDLQEQLDKGDFTTSQARSGNLFTVVYPKVAITCNLPIGFNDGNCVIQFSSILLRNLTISLDHNTILNSLMMGLYTKPQWGLRTFLTQLDSGFEVILGQTKVVLSNQETEDLCLCIDIVCAEYKNIILEAENLLQTWNFSPISIDDIIGFRLLGVPNWLWELMRKFATKFNYLDGESEWHTFDFGWDYISIDHRRIGPHAYIWPKTDRRIGPSDSVELLYVVPYLYHSSNVYGDNNSWQTMVGLRGLWTAKYTKDWLINQFIPRVIQEFANDINIRKFNREKDVSDDEDVTIPLEHASEPRELEPYVRMVELLLHSTSIRDARLLRRYYKSFADLARKANPDTLNLGYIIGKASVLHYHQSERGNETLKKQWDYYRDVLSLLYNNAARIDNVDYEDYTNIDMMTRIFAAIIGSGEIDFSQNQINEAKEALIPIRDLYRFERRHILEKQFLSNL